MAENPLAEPAVAENPPAVVAKAAAENPPAVVAEAAKAAEAPRPLVRNNTSYPRRLTTKLRDLYEEYTRARADGDRVAGILKYYQYLVRVVMSNPEYGIGADGNARGLLVYHTMGLGKTRLAVAVALALIDQRPPVVLLSRSLQKNFRETVAGVVAALNPGLPADELARLQAATAARFEFVSMDAYNSADQMTRVGTGVIGSRKARAGMVFGPALGGLDGKLLVVDEAHNFFRAIINSSAENANARRIYDMVMGARDLRIVFCTGTVPSKNPFELVPCFNMLAGRDLLPTQYESFARLYVDAERHAVRNREKLANRLVGLVSHATHTRPTAPPGAPGAKAASNVIPASGPRDDGWFPEELPTVVDRVEMGRRQYRQYLFAREKEDAEKAGTGAPGGDARPPPPLALPGSEKKALSTYYVRSRSLSTYCPPHEWAGRDLAAMPDEAFGPAEGPKLQRVAERALAAPGPVLVYSQFVDASGLGPAARYLRRAGFLPFEAPTPDEKRDPAEKRDPKRREADANEAGSAPDRAEPEAATTGGDEEYRRLAYDTTAAIAGIYGEIASRKASEAARAAPDDHIEEAFARARREGLLVSLSEPRESYGADTVIPVLMPGPRPGGILWMSRPDRDGATRSWYSFSKSNGLRWSGAGVAVVGYEVDVGRLLRVDSAAAVEEFNRRYGVCPEGVNPRTCALGSYINWARVAMEHPGVAFDPYVVESRTSRADAGFSDGDAPLWYHSLDAVTYMVWNPSVVKRVVVLYEPPKPEGVVEAKKGGSAPRYAIISGEVDPKERDAIKDAFNSPANVRGAVIKAILVSKTGAEGLDLKYLRETHQLEPYWDKARDNQVKARAVRMGCLDALPREDRVVQPYLYLGVPHRETYEAIPADDREPRTIDEVFAERAEANYRTNQAFAGLLAEVCLECDAFGYGNCRSCVPTDAPLFQDDPVLDAGLPDPCRALAEAEVRAAPLVLDGVTYFYTPDPAATLGYVFYEYRADLGGHSAVDPAGPLARRLRAALPA